MLHPTDMELREVLVSLAIRISCPPPWEESQELGREEGAAFPGGPISPTRFTNVRSFALSLYHLYYYLLYILL